MTATFIHSASSAPANPDRAERPAARVLDAVKVYGRGESEVRALDGVSVEFDTGRFTAILGPSG